MMGQTCPCVAYYKEAIPKKCTVLSCPSRCFFLSCFKHSFELLVCSAHRSKQNKSACPLTFQQWPIHPEVGQSLDMWHKHIAEV